MGLSQTGVVTLWNACSIFHLLTGPPLGGHMPNPNPCCSILSSGRSWECE